MLQDESWSKLSGSRAMELLQSDEYLNNRNVFITILRALQRKEFIEDMYILYKKKINESKYSSFMKSDKTVRYILRNLKIVNSYILNHSKKAQNKKENFLNFVKKQNTRTVKDDLQEEVLRMIYKKTDKFYERIRLIEEIIKNIYKIHEEYYKINRKIEYIYETQPGANAQFEIMELEEQLEQYNMKDIKVNSKPDVGLSSSTFSSISSIAKIGLRSRSSTSSS